MTALALVMWFKVGSVAAADMARVMLSDQARWARGHENAVVIGVERAFAPLPGREDPEHILAVQLRRVDGRLLKARLTTRVAADHGYSFREIKKHLEDPRMAFAFEFDRLGRARPLIAKLRVHPDCASLLDI